MGSISTKCSRNRNNNNGTVEQVLCKETDLQDNSMKEFEIGANGEKVLLVKQCGKFYAVGPKCTHYGAPLSTGTLGNGRIRCPWHGACFSLKTGDIEDFPGLDSLPCYDVTVANGNVKVRGQKLLFETKKRVKKMSTRDPGNCESILIIGGGAAGSSCAETLRQEGFTGKLLIISSDKYLPYDRVKVNKQLDSQFSSIALRTEEFYKAYDIEILLNEEVVLVDTQNMLLRCASGKQFEYSKLFIANGAKPRRVPESYFGKELQNIFTLRSLEDGNTIFRSLTPESNVVIIGSSFVGMEAAAFCTGKVKTVTVIGTSRVPFQDSLGEKVGQRILKLFESKGVVMKMSSSVKGFEGEDGKLRSVVLSDDTKLSADICVVGIGVEFDTKFLSNTDIKTTGKGIVDVNEYLQTNLGNVFAGGDVANAPVFVNNNEKASIGHWQLAQYHGRIAAFNLLGKSKPLRAVPFFFSMVFGKGIRYAGYGAGYTDVVVNGDLEELKFVAYYLKEDKVIAVATCGMDPVAAKFAELLYNEVELKRNEIPENAWTDKVPVNLLKCSA